MNYQDTLDDLSTLAHEYGHALHSHLAMTNQPYHDHRYVMFLAEIASTCNEALLSDYLVKKAESKEARIGILAAELETIRSTIYRQTLFSEFERPCTASSRRARRHRGPAGRDLRRVDQALLRPRLRDEPKRRHGVAYIPHFYYKYYVYSYATGLSCGIAIARTSRRTPAGGGRLPEDALGRLRETPLDLLKEPAWT